MSSELCHYCQEVVAINNFENSYPFAGIIVLMLKFAATGFKDKMSQEM